GAPTSSRISKCDELKGSRVRTVLQLGIGDREIRGFGASEPYIGPIVRPRQLEPEGAAHAERGPHAGSAAMRLADAPDGGETEADARLAGIVSSHVWIEEAVEERRLDAGPRVLHVEVYESIGRVTFAHPHDHALLRPSAHVLDSVAH